MLFACGSADRAHDRLGSEMSVSGAMAELVEDEERDESDLYACEDMTFGEVIWRIGRRTGRDMYPLGGGGRGETWWRELRMWSLYVPGPRVSVSAFIS